MFNPPFADGDATPVAKHLDVPSTSILLNAHYGRDGDDLVLDHGAYVVRGYFEKGQGPSDLISANGFVLSGKAVVQLAGQGGEYQIAQSGDGVAGAPLIGHVETISGTATAQRAGTVVQLTTGSDLFQGDVLETGPASKLGVSFIDKTVMTLSAGARIALDEVTYTPGGGNANKAFLSLVKGSAAFIAGMTAPAGGLKIETPVATAGIRGTMPIIVAPGEGGITAEVQGAWKFLTGEGSYAIENAQGQQIAAVNNLTKMVIISTAGAAPVEVDIPPDIAGRMQDGLNELLQTLQKMLERRAENTGSPEFDTASRFGSIDADEVQLRQIFTKLTGLLKETALQQDAPLEQEVALIVAPIEEAPLSLDLDGDDSSGVSGIDFTTSFIENGAGTPIADSDVSIVVGGSAVQIISATVALTNAQPGDSLAFGELPAGMTGSIDGTTITLTGALTLADYQAALQTITFASDSTNPSTTPRIISVTVTDSLGASTTASTTINVIAVNDAPQGADASVMVSEDGSYAFRAQDFGFKDGDGGSLKEVVITSLPANGKLFFAGVEVVEAGLRIAAADLGKLTFVPSPGASGDGYAQVGFQVVDTGGTENGGQDTSSGNLITINVGGVNDAPAGADATVTTNEDGSYTFAAADFGFSDSEGNQLQAVVISSTPAAGTLALDGVAVVAGQSVAAADIAVGLLVFTPAPNAKGVGYASFNFQVVDDGGTAGGGQDTDPTANTITIDVNSVNDAPSGTDKAISIAEDGSRTFSAADFGFKDSDGNALKEVIITALPGAGTLKLGGAEVAAGDRISAADLGNLVYAPDKDATGDAYATIRFQVVDDGGTANGGADTDPSANTITINVGGINDAPSGADARIGMVEDSSRALKIDDFGFSDSDGSGLLEVKIAGLPTAGELKLNGVAVTLGQAISAADIEAGKLVFTPAANKNGTGYASFEFQVVDNGGTDGGGENTDPTPNKIIFDVASVNDAPSGADKTVTIDEGGAKVFAAADFGFSDVNDTGNSFAGVKIAQLATAGSLTLGGVAVTLGQQISAADIAAGRLVFTPATEANGANYATFKFQVFDNGGTINNGADTDPKANTITVDVNSVNDAPSGKDSRIGMAEDSSRTLTANDFGFSDVKDGNTLLAVRIETLQGAGSLTLAGIQVVAGQRIAAADIDVGKLVFTPAANDNGEGYASFTFKVVDDGGTDNGGADTDPTANTIIFDVTSINDAPSGTDRPISIDEDSTHTFATSDFGFSDINDANNPNALAFVKIASLPTAGQLLLGDKAVVANQQISAADIAAGKLVFVPADNANGPGYATFTFQVVDTGGTSNGGVNTDPTPNKITINVGAVNDPPSGADNTLKTLEDTPITFARGDFGFSDQDGGAFSGVKITALPSLGALLLAGSPLAAGATVSVGDIDAGKLTFAPGANAKGSPFTDFTFQVVDNGGTASGGTDTDPTPNTIRIVVTSVNDAPSGTDNARTIDEDNSYTFKVADFGYSDAADSDALRGVKISTLPANGTLQLGINPVSQGQEISAADIEAGKLVFVPAAGRSGTGYGNFTFQVVDNGGTSDGGVNTDQTPNSFVINVNSVNDAPSGTSNTFTTLEDKPYTFSADSFGYTDNDVTSNKFQSIIISSLPASGSLLLGGNAVSVGQVIAVSALTSLVFVPGANASGNAYAKFTFQVQDDGGTANGGQDIDPTPNTITINVTPVNDAPFGADKPITIGEDESRAFSANDFLVSDVEGNTLKSIIIESLPGAGSLTFDAKPVSVGLEVMAADLAKLVFKPSTNATGERYASFDFRVVDTGGTENGGQHRAADVNTVTISVGGINDAPSGTDGPVTAIEDTAYSFKAADFGFTDVDDGGLLSVFITTLPTKGVLALNGVSVTAGQEIAAADISKLTFLAAPNDNGAEYAKFTFQVRDNGGTANGGVDTDPVANTITVNVLSKNDAPASADKTVTINEDQSFGFGVGDFGFNDVKDNDAFKEVIITTLPANGVLRLAEANVTAGQKILASDIGKLVFIPAADANGAGYGEFKFQVVDDGGRDNGGNDTSSTYTFTINVNSVNDAPSGADGRVTAFEDRPYTFVEKDFGFSDTAGETNALQSVIISTVPQAGRLTLDGATVVAGKTVSQADILAGKLKFEPAANENKVGYADFTFQVVDNGGVTNGGQNTDPTPNKITIDVKSVNDAPFGADNAITVAEDTTYAFKAADFGFSDPDKNLLKQVIITSLPAVGKLLFNGGDVTSNFFIDADKIGLLTYRPADDATGDNYASFSFKVVDDGGKADGGADTSVTANKITFNVGGINDAPSGTNNNVQTTEDTAYTFKTADFGFSDPENGALLSVKITTLPSAGLLKLNGADVVAGDFISATAISSGQLKYIPVADKFGPDIGSFTFQVRDNGGTVNGGVDTDPSPKMITISALAVNDAPVAASKTQTINEDGGGYKFSSADFAFTDKESNSLKGIFITSLPTAGTLKLGSSDVTPGMFISAALLPTLVFTPAPNANGTGYASFTFQVQDEGGTANNGVDTSNNATFTFNVTPVNDAPVNVLPASFSATDDAAISLSGLRVSDVDAGTGSITVTLSVTDGALFASGTSLVTVGGSGTGVLTLSGQVTAVDSFLASSLVDYRAPNNFSGNATLTMSTTDNGNSGSGSALTDTDTSVISVIGGPNYDISISSWSSLLGKGDGFFAAIAGNGAAGAVFRPIGPAGSNVFVSNNDVTVGQSAPNEIDRGEGVHIEFRAGVSASNGSGVTAEGAYLHATAVAFTLAQKNSSSGQADFRVTLYDSSGGVVDLTSTNIKASITGGGSIAIDATNNWITIDNGVAGTRFEIVSNSDLTFSKLDIVNTGAGLDSFTISGASIDILESTTIGTGSGETITGNAEANLLSGLGGNDLIIGNGGDDILLGGAGADTLRGGAGKDVFMFDGNAFSGSDTIEDYVHNTDAIDLSALFDVSPSAATATLDNGRLLFDADGAGNGASVQIATFAGPPPTAITILDDGKATVLTDA